MKLFLLYFLFMIAITYLSMLIIGDDFFLKKFNLNSSFTLTSIIILIVVPIYEELSFRWGLKYSKISFSFMVSSIIFQFISLLVNRLYNFENPNWFLLIISNFFVCLILFFLIKSKSNEITKLIFEKKMKIILTLSVLIFTAFHIPNYDHLSFNEKLPFLLHILISGIVFTDIRIKKGLLYSVMLHLGYNFFLRFMIL